MRTDYIAEAQLKTAREIVSVVQTFWLDLIPAKRFGGRCTAINNFESKQNCDATILGFVTAALAREGFLPNEAPKIYENFHVMGLSRAARRIAEEKGLMRGFLSYHISCESGPELKKRLDETMLNLPPPVPEFAQRHLAERAKKIGARY